jgi:hypothetical protein
MSLYNVDLQLDLVTGNIQDVTKIGPFVTGQSPFSSASGNVTGSPLNGSAYNGIGFNLSSPTDVDIARQEAIRLQLPAAIYEFAEGSVHDPSVVYNSDAVVGISGRVYTTYLTLLARTAYFLPKTESMTMHVTIVIKRLWVSAIAAHLLATILILIAVLGPLVQLAHRRERQLLHLTHPTGTIACAMSVGGNSQLGELLARQQDLDGAIHNRKFGLNRQTMQIMMNDEPGYTEATVDHLGRRRSIFSPFMQRPQSAETGELLGRTTKEP